MAHGDYDWIPFHESVVEMIEEVATSYGLGLLAALVKRTEIPGGHDKIAAAFNRKRADLGWSPDTDLGVNHNLALKKRTAKERKAKEMGSSTATR